MWTTAKKCRRGPGKRVRANLNSYKQMRRDPGLLEQTDYRTFDLRIFPIGPRRTRKCKSLIIRSWITTRYRHLCLSARTVTRKGVNARTTGKFAIAFGSNRQSIVELESPPIAARLLFQTLRVVWQANLESTAGSLDGTWSGLSRGPSADRHGPGYLTARGRGWLFLPVADHGQEVPRSKTAWITFLWWISRQHGGQRQIADGKDSVGAFLTS